MNQAQKIFNLDGMVSLVTGAGSGLGQAIAESYANFGAKVAVVDIDGNRAAAVVDGIQSKGGQAMAIACNVSQTEEVQSTVARVVESWGPIEVLVNNAGIGARSPAEEMTDEMWDSVLAVNLRGPFLFCREVGRLMIERGRGGRIINMASIGGLVGVETGNANYTASKGGIIAMTRCLAIEWAKHGILVNSIAPTHIRTPLIDRMMREQPEVKAYFLGNIPLGRIGEPSDVAGPAVFLASPAAAFMTGHTLVVDGGHTAK